MESSIGCSVSLPSRPVNVKALARAPRLPQRLSSILRTETVSLLRRSCADETDITKTFPHHGGDPVVNSKGEGGAAASERYPVAPAPRRMADSLKRSLRQTCGSEPPALVPPPPPSDKDQASPITHNLQEFGIGHSAERRQIILKEVELKQRAGGGGQTTLRDGLRLKAASPLHEGWDGGDRGSDGVLASSTPLSTPPVTNQQISLSPMGGGEKSVAPAPLYAEGEGQRSQSLSEGEVRRTPSFARWEGRRTLLLAQGEGQRTEDEGQHAPSLAEGECRRFTGPPPQLLPCRAGGFGEVQHVNGRLVSPDTSLSSGSSFESQGNSNNNHSAGSMNSNGAGLIRENGDVNAADRRADLFVSIPPSDAASASYPIQISPVRSQRRSPRGSIPPELAPLPDSFSDGSFDDGEESNASSTDGGGRGSTIINRAVYSLGGDNDGANKGSYASGENDEASHKVSLAEGQRRSGERGDGRDLSLKPGGGERGRSCLAMDREPGGGERGRSCLVMDREPGRGDRGRSCLVMDREPGGGERGRSCLAVDREPGGGERGRSCLAMDRESGGGERGRSCLAMDRESGGGERGRSCLAMDREPGGGERGRSCLAVDREPGGGERGRSCLAMDRGPGGGERGRSCLAMDREPGGGERGQSCLAMDREPGGGERGRSCLAMDREPGGGERGRSCLAMDREPGGGERGRSCLAMDREPGGEERGRSCLAVDREPGGGERGRSCLAVDREPGGGERGRSCLVMDRAPSPLASVSHENHSSQHQRPRSIQPVTPLNFVKLTVPGEGGTQDYTLTLLASEMSNLMDVFAVLSGQRQATMVQMGTSPEALVEEIAEQIGVPVTMNKLHTLPPGGRYSAQSLLQLARSPLARQPPPDWHTIVDRCQRFNNNMSCIMLREEEVRYFDPSSHCRIEDKRASAVFKGSRGHISPREGSSEEESRRSQEGGSSVGDTGSGGFRGRDCSVGDTGLGGFRGRDCSVGDNGFRSRDRSVGDTGFGGFRGRDSIVGGRSRNSGGGDIGGPSAGLAEERQC